MESKTKPTADGKNDPGDVVLVKAPISTRRARDVAKKKRTELYIRYIQAVPKFQRGPAHPRTPKPSTKCSARAWKGNMSKWSRDLHIFDDAQAEFKRLLNAGKWGQERQG